MKLTFFFPPVIALAVVAGWVGSERSAISTLERKSAVLKQRLAARASDLAADADSLKAKSPDQLAKEKAPNDWKKIASLMAEMRQTGGMGDMRTFIRLQQKLNAMSKEELVSALDEIAALDLPDESRQMLQQLLLEPLCLKDPEYALTRYFKEMKEDDPTMVWRLTRAMTDWTGKNPAAATAWLDQQIAAGELDSKSLDGKSRARTHFEGSLIGTLISTDPVAAALRLQFLSDDQRKDIFQSGKDFIKEKDQLAYANLVRSSLPEEAQPEILAQKASSMAWGEGYSRITEYLDRIKATPVERAVCVERAVESKIDQLSQAKKVTRKDIDAIRTWVASQSPETTDKVTGSVLAKSTRKNNQMGFSEAAGLASQYAEAGGSDDVLSSFLADCKAEPHYKEEAAVLAAKISDVKKREEILHRFK